MPQVGGGPRGLAVRVVALLSLALLPLGAISMWQTFENARQSDRASELALLLLTERASNELQAVIQQAYGATRALGQTVAVTAGTEACDATLSEFVDRFDVYSLAAFVDVDGRVTCASNGSRFTFTDAASLDTLRRRVDAPEPEVSFNPSGAISDMPVVLVSDAIFDAGGTLLGFLSLSVPAERLVPSSTVVRAGSDLSVVTFNHRGEVLTATGDMAEVDPMLPLARSLASLAGMQADVFTAQDRAGDRRIYGFVPLVPDVVYALSSWPLQSRFGPNLPGTVATAALPLLMWGASIVIAFWAIDRLAIRPIRALSRRMRGFAEDRRLRDDPIVGKAAAPELRRIETDFRDMARSILQDEATLENNLREKNVLLKEVHHRVKNNLQLVSSIMNMQIRRTASAETRGTLRRLQDRIMGMAAVHRVLYRSEDFTRIDAAVMLNELSEQLTQGVAGDVEVERRLSPITLVPEQAVPLSMLASEAITNAVKHMGGGGGATGRPRGGAARRIEVTLEEGPDGRARFAVSSRVAGVAPVDADAGPDAGPGPGPDTRSDTPAEAGGLGMQLIRAFEAQLEGELTITEEAGADGAARHEVAIAFPVLAAPHERLDY